MAVAGKASDNGRMKLAMVLFALIGCGDVVPSSQRTECFNGLDDEGAPNGMVDCADPTCEPYATCVPTTSAMAGIMVDADEPCPDGFEGGEKVVHQDLDPGSCEGCGCDVGRTECEARIWTYTGTNLDCAQDNGLIGGTMLGFTISTSCEVGCTPIWGITDNYGVRVDLVPHATCTPSGTATLTANRWQTSKKFCAASLVGSGCDSARACVPITAAPADQCILATGATTCDGFADHSTWYEGFDDQRTCGACLCEGVGGDCSNVQLGLGPDYSCPTTGGTYNFSDNEKQCWTNEPYSPCAGLLGTPSPPTGCTSSASPAGAITPTGESTLCCRPI